MIEAIHDKMVRTGMWILSEVKIILFKREKGEVHFHTVSEKKIQKKSEKMASLHNVHQ